MNKVKSFKQFCTEAAKATTMSGNDKKWINARLHTYGTTPQKQIPLDKFDELLRKRGYLLVNEDGTEWAGFLMGKDSRANIDIGVLGTENDDGIYDRVTNARFVLHYYKFAKSGRYEVTAYVS